MNIKKEINWNLITGITLVFINLSWIWDNLNTLYLYHYTGMLFLIMFPDWVLITNAIIGLIGTGIGIMTINRKMIIKQAIIMNSLILLIGFLLFILSR